MFALEQDSINDVQWTQDSVLNVGYRKSKELVNKPTVVRDYEACVVIDFTENKSHVPFLNKYRKKKLKEVTCISTKKKDAHTMKKVFNLCIQNYL